MLVKIGAALLAVILGLLSAVAVMLFQSGMATIYVHNEDLTLYLPVPVAALEIALWYVPQEELDEIREEIGPAREVLLAALGQLAECPDMTLVEIYDHGETVEVRKEGDSLIVDVQGIEEVRVEVPLKAAVRVVSALVRKPARVEATS